MILYFGQFWNLEKVKFEIISNDFANLDTFDIIFMNFIELYDLENILFTRCKYILKTIFQLDNFY